MRDATMTIVIPNLKQMVDKIKKYLSEGYRAQWCLFLLFGGLIFIKCVLFHWFSIHGILLSSIFRDPQNFFAFWMGKILPALFLSSFVFLSKRPWWTIAAQVLMDIWLIANLFYFKANGLFLSYEAMRMADNMDGFWNSLYMYMGWDIAIFPLLTIAYAGILFLLPFKYKTISLARFGILLIFSLLLSVVNNVLYAQFVKTWYNDNEVEAEKVPDNLKNDHLFHAYYPFGQVHYWATYVEISLSYNDFAKHYINQQSIISYFPACFIHDIWAPATGEIVPMMEEDVEKVKPLISAPEEVSASSNLVFILVESLESWPLHEVDGILYMPYLSELCKSSHAFFCEHLRSQVAHGNSADGQMINVAGLLPIDNGATCRLYYKNAFPCYAQCYPFSTIVNPSPGTWRQNEMTEVYQFKSLIEPAKGEIWQDADVTSELIQYIDTVPQPFCALGITISSHAPFNYGARHPKYQQEGMPSLMHAYLNTLHYVDSCIASVVEHVCESEKLRDNTIIVISGDHTIFRNTIEEFDQYALEHGVDLQTTRTFTPLVIYSPKLEQNISILDTCYQMDIYPTIMPLIGCEDYYWKGLGVNLLNPEAITSRRLSAEEASRLSNKLIRSNYFATIAQ